MEWWEFVVVGYALYILAGNSLSEIIKKKINRERTVS
jgi:hypothetical protein